MKKLNLERLGEFQQNMSDLKGGRPNVSYQAAPYLPTLSVGTYIDGFSVGTDGYKD